MFWPRLILTPDEEKYCTKYYTPERGRGVLRRLYQGHLETSETTRQPFWNFQIARRCRVFAFTGIGDVHQIRLQFQDATGEQYFVQPMVATQVFGGWAATGLQLNVPVPGTEPGNVGAIVGSAMYVSPFVFEPNIELTPNQVLNIIGEPVRPWNGTPYRMDFTIHVWEFPNFRKNGKAKP